MARRDQPYLPFYVNDWLTDEKLIRCSAATQGVYVRIMCMLHKSEEYGTFLLKQNDKQNASTCLNFANVFARILPFSYDEIRTAFAELLEQNVLEIEGDRLIQRRMVRDAELSAKRSIAGSKGIKIKLKKEKKNPSKHSPDFAKAKSKQNTEYESEYLYKDNKKGDCKEGNTENTDWIVTKVVETYAKLCPHLPQVAKLTPQRRSRIVARHHELKKNGWTWTQVFGRVAASDFLSGRKGSFKASLDFIIRSDDQLVKIIEGQYDNGTADGATDKGRLYTYEEMCSEIPARARSEDFKREIVNGEALWRKIK